ncbi:MAG: lipopolysaccharide biosynthesis protein [Acidobacteria bacterium]|nr:lipopolysaccharide biosynthesis protein [Acidobacteriota bacterium]
MKLDKDNGDRHSQPSTSDSLTRTTIVGGIWAILNNIATKSLGGIKAIVLARLLSPSDFGLMGLALAAVGTANMFSSPGIYTALIQKKQLEDNDLNVAWWIHAARGLFLFLIFLPLAGWVGNFYHESGLKTILRVVALTFLLDGFQSIGLVRLNRTLNFRRLMRLHQTSNIVSLIVGVSLAWLLRNVWALVTAHLAQLATVAVLSYTLQPFRPTLRVDWRRGRHLLHFGKYVFIAAVCYFLVIRGNEFLLAKMIGLKSYGYYALAMSLVGVAAGPIEQLITSVALPALSRIQEESERLAAAFAKLFRTAMMLAAPLFVGIAILGSDLVSLALGQKWQPMVGPLMWLCLFAWFRSLIHTFDLVYCAIGKPKLEAALRGIELFLFGAGIVPVIWFYGARGAAAFLFSIQAVSLLLHMLVARRYVIGVLPAVAKVWITFSPLFGGQLLFTWVRWHLADGSNWAQFILLGTLYALFAVSFVAWRERTLLATFFQTRPVPKIREDFL